MKPSFNRHQISILDSYKSPITWSFHPSPSIPSCYAVPGYIIHPSLFDGTIHAVCATMFDQDPPFLKIFAGVGKVTVVTKEAVVGMWISEEFTTKHMGFLGKIFEHHPRNPQNI